MGFDCRAGFKPDVYTGLGIMQGNQWRLEPTLYKVGEVQAWSEAVPSWPLPLHPQRSSPWGRSGMG